MGEQNATRAVPVPGTTGLPSRPDTATELTAFRTGALAVGAVALGALAIGAVAVGARAIGALAVGRLALGGLALGRGRARHVEAKTVVLEELIIGRLRVREYGRLPRLPDNNS